MDRGQHFGKDNELQASIVNWLEAQVAAFYDKGIRKLVTCYNYCLFHSSDCREVGGRFS